MIEALQYTKFTTVGLNTLSSLETRYLGYMNTYDLSFDEGNAEIKIEVMYEDINGQKFSNYYVLNLDELKGITKIGKSFDEQHIEQLKDINKTILGLNKVHDKFLVEYEKSHRDWTEGELREKVSYFDSIRRVRKNLGQEVSEPLIYQKLSRRSSIHELRKNNK